jgi:arabinan endo-1,5-alpha-L-arabinosidase
LNFALQLLMAAIMLEVPASGGSIMPRAHDPAIIRQGAYYYVFSTGPRIPIQRSTDLIHWQRIGRVFPGELPQWALDAIPGTTGYWWAPDISFSNGLYRLYYSVSTFGSQRSAIGLAVNKTLDVDDPDYMWVDCGMVIDSAPGRSDFNAIDADAFTDDGGKQWLLFGSFCSGVKMARLDPATGFLADPNIIALAGRPDGNAIEGPCLIHHDGFYYLFVSFDLCCKGVDSTYRIMVGRSKTVTGPYFDRDGCDMREGGGTLVLAGDEDWKGPGHNEILQDEGKDYLVHHAYDVNFGRATLLIRPMTWDNSGWPIPGKPLQP